MSSSRPESAPGNAYTPANATVNNEVANSDILKWEILFNYDRMDARVAILSHRSDPSVHVPHKDWAWVRWGHENAGYNKEAYEHLLVLKASARKWGACKEKGTHITERIGDVSKISLEGYLTPDIVTGILEGDKIKGYGPDKKWCYIDYDPMNELRVSSWVQRRENAVARGKKLYNDTCEYPREPNSKQRLTLHFEGKERISGQNKVTALGVAGSRNPPPISQNNHQDIRVGFVRFDNGSQATMSPYVNTYSQYPQISPIAQSRRPIYSIAELEDLRPSSLDLALPPVRKVLQNIKHVDR